ncbi:hypothetical protein Gocc_2894 [Gaiella occulta]|uniref:Uncharacterized protein n=1 Tax=Gaiella occulta TaxID=1002870 RepID=A0A7M2YTS4_9ACTN|nr:hypothetical protein [Gaiella occulta]RDI73294.1 hypothetical protein Gocc_2894 [Gaiella occulta]
MLGRGAHISVVAAVAGTIPPLLSLAGDQMTVQQLETQLAQPAAVIRAALRVLARQGYVDWPGEHDRVLLTGKSRDLLDTWI